MRANFRYWVGALFATAVFLASAQQQDKRAQLSAEDRRVAASMDAAWERNKKLPGTLELLQSLKSKNADSRRYAAKMLGKIEPDFNVELFDDINKALTKALEDPDPTVGELAAHAYARIRCSSYPPNERIFKLLDSPRREVVRNTITALRVMDSQAFGASEGVQLLEKPSLTGAERLRAISILASEQVTGYIATLLVRCLDVKSADVKVGALKVLGSAQCGSAFDALVRASKDSDARVRKSAIEAMYKTYDRRFLAAIRARTKDASKDVRAAASKIAMELAGMDRSRGPNWPMKMPRFVDLKLGDFELRDTSDVKVFDPKRRLFLSKGAECDGADLWIAISSEPGAMCIPDALHDMVEGNIGDMKTGNGIGLGDTQSAVRAKLGKPRESHRDGGRSEDSYVYKYQEYTYVGSYAYRNGKLAAIMLSRSCPE